MKTCLENHENFRKDNKKKLTNLLYFLTIFVFNICAYFFKYLEAKIAGNLFSLKICR